MSATTQIEDEYSVKQPQEAEIAVQNAAITLEGHSEPSLHKAIVKDDDNGGKLEITPSKQPSEEALANVENADDVNKTKSQSLQQLDHVSTDIKHDKSSGDFRIQSENTITIGKDKTATEITPDLIENADKLNKNETVLSKMVMEDASSAKVTFIDNKSVINNDITSQDVCNDNNIIIKNTVEPLSQCTKDTETIDSVTSQTRDDEPDSDMRIDNEDDELELKWDDDNDDDLMKDDMECDAGIEEQVETLADESSMDIDFNNDEGDVLNDNPTVNKDNNYVETSNVGTIRNADKETDVNAQNDENTNVINENVNESELNAPISNENKEMKIQDHEISLSQDVSMDNSSDLINKDHGIHRPDVMLEIPTQELIDIDDADLSLNLDQSNESPEINEILTDNNDMPVNDNKITGNETTVTVKDVELGITADTKMQENVIDSLKNKTEKVVDSNSQEQIQPSTSSITDEIKTGMSEMADVTDSQGKSGSSDILDDVAKVSISLNPVVSGEEDKVSESVSPTAPENNITEDSMKSPEALDSVNPGVTISVDMSEDTDNTDPLVSSPNKTPVTPDKVTAVSDSINLIATTSDNTPEDTVNSGLSESCTEMSLEPSGKVSEICENVNLQATTSSELYKVTANVDTLMSSNKMSLNTPSYLSDPPSTSKELPAVSNSIVPEPSTSGELPPVTDNLGTSVSPSKMIPDDTSDELPEVSDSLGLLAESSRVMEDDDYQEDDEDGDDDDDFDQDESSNQMTTAEHSEDSNAHQSESEANRDEKETDISPPVESEGEFQFMISNVESQGDEKKDMESIEVPVEQAVNNEDKIEDIAEAVEAIEPLDETQQVDDDQTRIETVRLSDTSDNEVDAETREQTREQTEVKSAQETATSSDPSKLSPSKTKKLELSSVAQPVFNIVDLEESSSEDDVQEINKDQDTVPEVAGTDGVTSVNLPNGIEVMCTSAGNTSEIVTKEGEIVINGVPRPPPVKPARLNTSEISIKTAGAATESTLVIPEAKTTEKTSTETRVKPKLCLEIFSLDSDEEDSSTPAKEQQKVPCEPEPAAGRCMNPGCRGALLAPHAPRARAARATLCQPCAAALHHAKQNLITGIKDLRPLLELGADKLSQELVEISDSESEDEADEPKPPSDTIGEKGARMLEENLAAMFNETWRKYKMDARLKDTHDILDAELLKLENESKEIDDMLNECQVATDQLRNELYATFERGSRELPSFLIFDTPMTSYMGPETEKTTVPPQQEPLRQSKRRLNIAAESPAKKPAIPLGYTSLDTDTAQQNIQDSKTAVPDGENKIDDDTEVSVVRLSAEAAPADLPPAGPGGGAAGGAGAGAGGPARPPLRAGAAVFAMRNAFGPWLRGKILECQPKSNMSTPYTMCRVKFDHKVKNPCKILSARCLAYPEPAEYRMTIGTRIIALYKDPGNIKREQFFSGVVAEIPNPVNSYRYLVFFDDGYAQYVQHSLTRLVCESSSLVWEEVHPFSRQFVKDYLMSYPERPMVRLHEGQSLKTEWNGKWWSSRVLVVDASLAQVLFLEDGRKEWVYRGSTRLAPLYLEFQAAGRHRQRPMPRSKAATGSNMPYVEYTRSEEQDSNKQQNQQTQQQQNEEMRRQRAVARKSTAAPPPSPAPAPAPPPAPAPHNLDTVTSRVVYYTPKAAVKPFKMVPHSCGPRCRRSDVLSLKELRTYNPLAKPLLSGWERQIVRYKGHKEVMYRAPCGRRIRDMAELHRYLRITQSELPVDLFDFFHGTHCLAEFVLNKCLVGKKDLSHGKENVPVPCVNYYDDSLPEFCSYNTERTPTAGVPLNLDPDFLCGCDCTDDCKDKSKCACWRMTLEGAHTIGLEGPNVGYVYKRLPEPLPSGIYECNSRCKCKATCLNRVAQHPLQLKLQVFKTLNRGWGIRALNDIPKGAFLCVYAGNLLTDATANLDGLNEGDEYLAELDYIEVVEQMKEGYEEDIPAADRKMDKRELVKQEESSEEESPSEDEGRAGTSDKEDDDFQPGYIGLGVMEFNKALRKRDKTKKHEEEKGKSKETDKEHTRDDTEDCITISDDEEVREPSRFTAQAGMGANAFISKYRSVRSHFGKDEACYIMDAKVQGNIGRYLNHSCTPNVFVQNVFVDTHDPRFPWVAFFALSHIRAGTELTWNYNYDVGSVPGKVLYCFCGAPNCRGRLL